MTFNYRTLAKRLRTDPILAVAEGKVYEGIAKLWFLSQGYSRAEIESGHMGARGIDFSFEERGEYFEVKGAELIQTVNISYRKQMRAVFRVTGITLTNINIESMTHLLIIIYDNFTDVFRVFNLSKMKGEIAPLITRKGYIPFFKLFKNYHALYSVLDVDLKKRRNMACRAPFIVTWDELVKKHATYTPQATVEDWEVKTIATGWLNFMAATRAMGIVYKETKQKLLQKEVMERYPTVFRQQKEFMKKILQEGRDYPSWAKPYTDNQIFIARAYGVIHYKNKGWMEGLKDLFKRREGDLTCRSYYYRELKKKFIEKKVTKDKCRLHLNTIKEKLGLHRKTISWKGVAEELREICGI